MNGKVYHAELDGWNISWESQGEYRHWCIQHKPKNTKTLLVIMFNPGSLNADGKNLSRDTTLRILREVCGEAGFNQIILNLFDYADPKSEGLFVNWDKKDSENLVFDRISEFEYDYYIMAYGSYEFGGMYGDEIRNRIKLIQSLLRNKEILLPRNTNGTPKHPTVWQRQKLKPEIIQILASYAKSLTERES